MTGVAVGAVAFDAGAGATLPKYTSMKNMYVETVISGYEKLYNGTATEFSLGWPQSKDHCTLGNGTMAQLKSAMKWAISGHHRFAAELGVETGKSCGTVIPISTYSKLVKSIVTAVKTHTSWSKYWGGVVLDEEGSWGFKNSVITNFNRDMDAYFSQTFGYVSTSKPYWVYDQWGGAAPSWDKAKAINSQISDPTHQLFTRFAPQIESKTAQTLLESWCKSGVYPLLCHMIPTANKSGTGPGESMSADTIGETIPGWTTADWYINWTGK